MKPKINIYDIAEEAGVSVSSVSRVLNNKENVTPEIRAKVEPVLKKYKYKPNAVARGLVKNSINTVAVLTVDIRVSHYGLTMYAIEQVFTRKGYQVIVSNTAGDFDRSLSQISKLLDLQVDGLVFVGSVFEEVCNSKEFKKIIGDVKYVIANGKVDSQNAVSVLVDDIKGVSISVDKLIDNECKNIYYVRDLDTESARRKEEGYAYSAKKIDCEKNIVNTSYGLEGGKEVIDYLVNNSIEFDGLVFGEDLTAAGAMLALNEHNIKIPEQVQIIGYNNSDYAKLTFPPLASIDNKPDTVGNLCANMLIDLMDGQEGNSVITLDPVLKTRNSIK